MFIISKNYSDERIILRKLSTINKLQKISAKNKCVFFKK